MVPEYILIAEDDAAFRGLLVDLLTDEGLDTRTARDGIEALEHCERQLPQLLITDLQMPRLGGAELVTELEARKLGNFPVVVISGQFDLLANAPAFAAHTEAKPCDFENRLLELSPAPTLKEHSLRARHRIEISIFR